MLKSKASLLEEEAWGYFVASLAGTKSSALWDILEDLFNELPEAEDEEGPPSMKIHMEDESSTSYDPLDPKLPTTTSSKIKIAFHINEGSIHDSGISQEFLPIQEQLPHRKAVYLYGFQCDYHTLSKAIVCTHTCKDHLNTMLGCPHCDHHMWSTNEWVKHVHTHHPKLPMLLEMKLEPVTPAESAEVLEALATSQGPSDTSVQKWKVFHLLLCFQ